MPNHVTTLTTDFLIEIPEAVRQQLHWVAGQKLALIPRGNGVLVIPVPSRDELEDVAEGAECSGYRDREDRDERR